MPQLENKILANRLKTLANELIGISKNVENTELSSDTGPLLVIARGQQDPSQDTQDDDLAEYAERIYQERRRRTRHFPAHLFAEPAWDILLDLFVNGIRHRAISITSACIAGGIPATTGLRWLGVLEKEGILVREMSEEDARVTLVRLSDHGMDMMRGYLSNGSGLRAVAPLKAASAG